MGLDPCKLRAKWEQILKKEISNKNYAVLKEYAE
jgi:hypothetical protein